MPFYSAEFKCRLKHVTTWEELYEEHRKRIAYGEDYIGIEPKQAEEQPDDRQFKRDNNDQIIYYDCIIKKGQTLARIENDIATIFKVAPWFKPNTDDKGNPIVIEKVLIDQFTKQKIKQKVIDTIYRIEIFVPNYQYVNYHENNKEDEEEDDKQTIHRMNKAWFICNSFIEDNDIHRWIFAREGFKEWEPEYKTNEHIHFYFESTLSFEEILEKLPGFHLDEVHVEKYEDREPYYRKRGNFYAYDDNEIILRQRFGRLKENQENILDIIRQYPPKITWEQFNRTIYYVYDQKGNHGKSWLVSHLHESGQALYVPSSIEKVETLEKTIASMAINEYEPHEIIAIDCPRSHRKITRELAIIIERTKDGLVCEPRYSAKIKNIAGRILVIFGNSFPDLNALSIDRWKIIDAETGYLIPSNEWQHYKEKEDRGNDSNTTIEEGINDTKTSRVQERQIADETATTQQSAETKIKTVRRTHDEIARGLTVEQAMEERISKGHTGYKRRKSP